MSIIVFCVLKHSFVLYFLLAYIGVIIYTTIIKKLSKKYKKLNKTAIPEFYLGFIKNIVFKLSKNTTRKCVKQQKKNNSCK